MTACVWISVIPTEESVLSILEFLSKSRREPPLVSSSRYSCKQQKCRTPEYMTLKKGASRLYRPTSADDDVNVDVPWAQHAVENGRRNSGQVPSRLAR